MMNTTCDDSHKFAHDRVQWEKVLESQREPWRHRCAACAYEQGYRDAIRDMRDSLSDMSKLEGSQGQLL